MSISLLSYNTWIHISAWPPREVIQNLAWGLLKATCNIHTSPGVWSTFPLLLIGIYHVTEVESIAFEAVGAISIDYVSLGRPYFPSL